jgi:hypothetical protein
VLQGRLIDGEQRMKLWERGRHKNAFYVGFLQSVPDALPGESIANPVWERTSERLADLHAAGNPFAVQLCRLLSATGQNYLAGVEAVLKKPANQDVMVELMHALASHAEVLPLERPRLETTSEIHRQVEGLLEAAGVEQAPELAALLQALPGAVHHIRAMLFLALLDEPVLDPVLSRTDAIGTVMRKKLGTVTVPVQEQIDILKHK